MKNFLSKELQDLCLSYKDPELLEEVKYISRDYQDILPIVLKKNYFREKIKNSGKVMEKYGAMFSFYKHISEILDLRKLANEYGYPDDLKSLLWMNESEYKVKYPNTYKQMYESLSYGDKENAFVVADYGMRSVFSSTRDTFASNILENKLCHDSISPKTSMQFLFMNEGATDIIGGNVTTNPDCIFKYKDVETYVEVKTKWDKDKPSNPSFRGGGYDNLESCGGIALIVYPNINKCALIDTRIPQTKISGEMAGGKSCVKIALGTNPVMDFKMGDYESMRRMLNEIYKMRKNELKESLGISEF